jgi:hypothetical protein
LAVHEDEVDGAGLHQFQHLKAMIGEQYLHAEGFEHGLADELVGLVVVGKEGGQCVV